MPGCGRIGSRAMMILVLFHQGLLLVGGRIISGMLCPRALMAPSSDSADAASQVRCQCSRNWNEQVWACRRRGCPAHGPAMGSTQCHAAHVTLRQSQWYLYSSAIATNCSNLQTWSGPAGWLQLRARPPPAWLLLAIISLAPYIALPLSAFTLQLTNGYSTSNSTSTASLANLVGLQPDNFLDQNLEDVFTR